MAQTYTRSQAQDNAVEAIAQAKDRASNPSGQAYATIALAWATLAQSLPAIEGGTSDRPFGEATSR
jgi:hypothetical protein